ncbi:hypothetical protein F5X99DRAFT_84977 [Biscogniauxia marginata]|nr:hypothetical protein F5X99DRAFT_84977 [Biscogniauxia marginata]
MNTEEDGNTRTYKRDPIPIHLVPWDPDSPEHVERMKQQRVACGWKVEMVEEWRSLQRDGHVGMHWIVLDPSHPETPSRLQMHTEFYPTQAEPLHDSCEAVFSRPHTPNADLSTFLPIGHISLDGVTPDVELGTDPSKGVYSLMNFYISNPLQNFGLGGAAMDTCERMAREDFNARTITLGTIADEDSTINSIEMNRPIPKVTNQVWYGRRGYSIYARKKDAWFNTDSTGKVRGITAVFLRKDLEFSR